MEVLGGFRQSCIAHQVLTVLELATLLEKTFSLGLRGQVGVGVLVSVAHRLGHVVPVDLELCHSRLLSEDVSVESLDDGGGRRVLVQLDVVVLDVDVVADSQELLAVLVGASQKDSGDSNNVGKGKSSVVWSISLLTETRNSDICAKKSNCDALQSRPKGSVRCTRDNERNFCLSQETADMQLTSRVNFIWPG